MAFVKLDSNILLSSVWCESLEVRVLWISMLAAADAEGVVRAAAPGLAKLAGLPLADTLQGLEVLLSPDPYSKSPEHEGRRIERTGEGFLILNYRRYREKNYSMSPEAIRKREWRERAKSSGRDIRRDIVPPLSGHSASASVISSSESSSSRRKKKRLKKEYPQDFMEFWKAYPKKVAKPDALRAWVNIDPQPDQELLDKMLGALEWQRNQSQWTEAGGKYVPHPATWLNARRWEDEPLAAGADGYKADYGTWEALNATPKGSRAIGQRPLSREAEAEQQAAADLAAESEPEPKTAAERLEELRRGRDAMQPWDARRESFNREIARLENQIAEGA